MLIRIGITAVIVAAAIGMMLIAATQNGSFITALMWIGAVLVVFLLPRPVDSDEDER